MSDPRPEPAPTPPCSRHPDRPASVLCAHCQRPVCTSCMVAAPVGWQCPPCAAEGARRSRQVPAFTRTRPGRTGVVGSTNPTPVVLAIIALNVVVFVLEDFGRNLSVITRFALWPDAMYRQHEYYRAFTSMWMHANFLHIGFNMFVLLIVGPALEVLLGKVRFIVLYLLAGLGGSVGSYLIGPHNELGLGASGAIMGVMGAYIVLGLRRHLPVAPVVGLLALNVLIGFSGNIDWRAHFGGLVTGCLLALAYDWAGGRRDPAGQWVVSVAVSVAVLALLGVLLTGIAPGHVNVG